MTPRGRCRSRRITPGSSALGGERVGHRLGVRAFGNLFENAARFVLAARKEGAQAQIRERVGVFGVRFEDLPEDAVGLFVLSHGDVAHREAHENLFRTANSRSALEALLCPDIGDGSLVSPEIFEADLHALLEKLRKSENPKIQALVREEIEPLLQNGLLLTAYRNLMLGG